MTDADRLTAYCRNQLDLQAAKKPEEYGYSHLPLGIIDSVWSIGVRYEGVKNVVNRYAVFAGIRSTHPGAVSMHSAQPEPEHSVTDFLRLVQPHTPEFLAENLFQNRQRTSARSGILKSEAVRLFAESLLAAGVNTRSDLNEIGRSKEIERRIKLIPGQGSGLSLKYFFMISGDDSLVKPDRVIYRFLQSVLGRQVTEDEAQELLSQAASNLKSQFPNISPRLLDNVIWQYQRSL